MTSIKINDYELSGTYGNTAEINLTSLLPSRNNMSNILGDNAQIQYGNTACSTFPSSYPSTTNCGVLKLKFKTGKEPVIDTTAHTCKFTLENMVTNVAPTSVPSGTTQVKKGIMMVVDNLINQRILLPLLEPADESFNGKEQTIDFHDKVPSGFVPRFVSIINNNSVEITGLPEMYSSSNSSDPASDPTKINTANKDNTNTLTFNDNRYTIEEFSTSSTPARYIGMSGTDNNFQKIITINTDDPNNNSIMIVDKNQDPKKTYPLGWTKTLNPVTLIDDDASGIPKFIPFDTQICPRLYAPGGGPVIESARINPTLRYDIMYLDDTDNSNNLDNIWDINYLMCTFSGNLEEDSMLPAKFHNTSGYGDVPVTLTYIAIYHNSSINMHYGVGQYDVILPDSTPKSSVPIQLDKISDTINLQGKFYDLKKAGNTLTKTDVTDICIVQMNSIMVYWNFNKFQGDNTFTWRKFSLTSRNNNSATYVNGMKEWQISSFTDSVGTNQTIRTTWSLKRYVYDKSKGGYDNKFTLIKDSFSWTEIASSTRSSCPWLPITNLALLSSKLNDEYSDLEIVNWKDGTVSTSGTQNGWATSDLAKLEIINVVYSSRTQL